MNTSKKSELVIRPTNLEKLDGGKLMLDTSYYIEKDNKRFKRYLSDTLAVIEIDERSEREKERNGVIPIPKFDAYFDKENGYCITIPLMNGVNRENVINWAKGHKDSLTDILLITNDKQANTQFVFTITDEVVANSNKVNKEMAEIYSRFSLLEESQKQTVSLNFGVSPFDLDEEELTNVLVSFSNGIITQNADNRKEFLEGFDKMFDQLKVNIKAGVIYNCIKKDEFNVFTLEGTVLGRSENEVYSVLTAREDLRSQLKRDLVRLGKYIETSDESTKSQFIKEKEDKKKSISDKEKALKIETA
jgi:hypothetical protein